jgi:hypothetical protein
LKFRLIVSIFPNLVTNNYKSHGIVNGLVTFWLISNSDGIVICETLLIDVKMILITSPQHQIWPFFNPSSNLTQRKFQKHLLKNHNLKGKKTKKNIVTRTYVRIWLCEQGSLGG